MHGQNHMKRANILYRTVAAADVVK